MSTHYAAGFRALEQAAKQAEVLTQAAVDLGMSPAGLNVDNAVRAVVKAAKSYSEAEDRARELGYTSLATALKALGQKRTFLHVPTELTIAPSHWQTPRQYVTEDAGFLRGRRTERKRAVAAIDAVKAQQMLQRLLPVMDEYCESADPEELEAIKEGFHGLSYQEFSRALYESVAELRGRDLEGIELQLAQPSPEAQALEQLVAKAGV